MFSTFFFLTQFLQGVEGFSALQAGLAFLPMTVVMFSMGRVVPRLTPRFGDAPPADRRAGARGRRHRLAEPGHRRARTTSRSIAMPARAARRRHRHRLHAAHGRRASPASRQRDAGAASGLLNVAQQLGGSLGLGILITVFAAATHQRERLVGSGRARARGRDGADRRGGLPRARAGRRHRPHPATCGCGAVRLGALSAIGVLEAVDVAQLREPPGPEARRRRSPGSRRSRPRARRR